MQRIRVRNTQDRFLRANAINSRRIKMLNHPVRVRVLRILERLVDEFQGPDIFERGAIVVDLLSYPFVELVCSFGVVVALVELRWVYVLHTS